MVTYRCGHCRTEIGSVPFASVKETIAELQKSDDGFLSEHGRGSFEIRCICEQCEDSLSMFPEYYTVEKWLQ
ncbi:MULTISPECIES: anti-sigma-F factor Fin [Sporosarcina]|uniref:anti-sigma-F factor Fin n=1 Tax=Sporosarcina TaxID=1569 RepID=UPI00058FBDB5|nr:MULTISPECIES: anti-sigma-F factor Fin [Sporosarcina]WJY26726.1 DUF2757 family protein [Sporosarcina sp. 0.2-SM1T-5]